VTQGLTERALEIADSSRGRVLAERDGAAAPRRANVSEMRRLARETSSMYLSYWVMPARSYLFAVTRDKVSGFTLPPSSEIETLVRAHQAALSNALVDPLAARDSAGDKLYRMLIGPVAGQLPPNASVVVMPDGPLHGINFETLPVDHPTRRH